MPAPTIIIVPGLWLGPRPYELMVQEMKKVAPTLEDFVYAPLVSTGKASPGNPTVVDDAMGVREVIKPLVESGKRLVIIAHSAGAYISAMATEDLEVGQKIAKQSGGGVERFIFVTGGILPAGVPHPPMQMMDIQGGKAFCRDPDGLLFHDVDPDVAKKYASFFECQPAEGWDTNCTYAGWDKVPSSYIFCEHDRVILPEVQEMCSKLAGSEVIKIPTGHMPILSNPKLLAEKIVPCLRLQ